MKKVVITGPTGCIGVALSKLLLSQGCEVYAVCRPNSPNIQLLPKDPSLYVMESDIKDYSRLDSSLGAGFDAFFHLAWSGTFGSDRNDGQRQLDNVRYTLNAVKLAKDLGCRMFVGAGSQAEYGHFDRPADDTLVPKPYTFYGAAKLSAGEMGRVYASQLGIAHTWVRIFSIYGPGDDKNTLVQFLIREMLAGRSPALTAGEQTWDYLYSDDAALALYAIAQFGKDGAVYNLGSGEQRPLGEYIAKIRDIVSPGLKLKLGERPYGQDQIMFLSADIGKLTQDTGFVPRTGFEKGIKQAHDAILSEERQHS
jgi:nucleoside-diphosphate-sugar epimerase